MSSNISIELYVRSLSPSGAHTQQQTIISRLEQLQAGNHIAEFTVHVWGDQLDLFSAAAQTDAGQFILDKITAFRQWARHSDYSLRSVFETRDVHSEVTDEHYTVLVLPTMTLAEYQGDELRFVAPCTEGDTTYTVTDRLNTLDSDTLEFDQEPPDTAEVPLIESE